MKHKVKQDYAVSRKRAYPSVEEQLDILYHEGDAAWRAKIKKVKDKFPKPVKPPKGK